MNKVLRFFFLNRILKSCWSSYSGERKLQDWALTNAIYLSNICSDTKSNFMLLVVYSGESNFIVPRHFSWNKCVNCQIWVLQLILISFIRSLHRLCLDGFCWAVAGNPGPDFSEPPWLRLLQLLSQKNTVLSICLHLSNLDCDRKREHGISPISLSLEKCFVKHNCKKINSQTEQFQDISKWLLLERNMIWIHIEFSVDTYLFFINMRKTELYLWTLNYINPNHKHKRAILETRYFAFICCL